MKTINPSTPLRVNGERSRTIKFFTLGCKVNQYETQSIREQFIQVGFKELENSQPADTYVINTCTVTHRADSESLNLIRRARRENSNAKIVVTGCLTELDADRIKKIDDRSLIVKNRDKNRILELINGHNELNELNEQTDSTNRGISFFKGHTRAFLKIQDGCSNFCSYCKVPLVRGRSNSKDLFGIVKEAKALVKNGFKEIILCGICLGAYGKDMKPKRNLIDVVERLEKIDGLLRLRLSSIEAGDITEDLIAKISQSELACRQTGKLCRHLHIPLQSGDDEILSRMKRNYSGKDFLSLILNIRSRIPEIAITTDVLVGFPGETEINFQNTVDLLKEILPLRAHIFPYSPRESTPAFNFQDKVSPKVIKKRILRLSSIVSSLALVYKKQFLNKSMEVLIERSSKENPNFWQGYTDNYIKILVESKRNLKNQLITMRLKKMDKDNVLADFC